MDALKNCLKPAILRRALRTLPRTLDETYERILKNVKEEHLEDVLKMLRWLIYAKRPLTLSELAEAVAISVDDAPIFDPESRLRHPVDSFHLCSSLISVTSVNLHGDAEDDPVHCVIRLAHYSVQEYLLSNSVVSGSRISLSFEQSTAQAYIGKACLTYLLYLEKLLAGKQYFSRRAVQKEYVLYKYSAEYWDDHGTMTDAITGTLVQVMFHSESAFIIWTHGYNKASLFTQAGIDETEVSDDDDEDNDFDHMDDKVYLDKRYYRRRTACSHYCRAVYVASYFGLTGLVEKLVGQVEDVNMVLGKYGTALGAAAFQGHTDVLRVLLERGARPDIEFEKFERFRSLEAETSLHAAILRGHVECTRLLVAVGSCVNQKWIPHNFTRYKVFETPLSLAARCGHVDVLQLLIEKGADVNGNHTGTFTKAPLLEAVDQGYAEIVQVLLRNGANVNDIGLPSGYRRCSTPLLTAINSDRFQVAKILIDNGADVSVTVTTDLVDVHVTDAPLVAAARYGSKDITQLLLEKGANVNVQVEAFASSRNVTVPVTPLLVAVEGGHKEAVQVLLAYGADVTSKGRHGNARETALCLGHDDIAALLPSSN